MFFFSFCWWLESGLLSLVLEFFYRKFCKNALLADCVRFERRKLALSKMEKKSSFYLNECRLHRSAASKLTKEGRRLTEPEAEVQHTAILLQSFVRHCWQAEEWSSSNPSDICVGLSIRYTDGWYGRSVYIVSNWVEPSEGQWSGSELHWLFLFFFFLRNVILI